jgi:hypothetical protein
MRDFPQSSDAGSQASPRHGRSRVTGCHESKFLNHREESLVSQISSQSQKIFIKYLCLHTREPLFQALGVTMAISNYLDDVFRDCFSG